MSNAFKVLGGILMALSFFVILGTAGADCDGACMENSLTIGEIFRNLFLGIACGFFGYQMFKYGEERD